MLLNDRPERLHGLLARHREVLVLDVDLAERLQDRTGSRERCRRIGLDRGERALELGVYGGHVPRTQDRVERSGRRAQRPTEDPAWRLVGQSVLREDRRDLLSRLLVPFLAHAVGVRVGLHERLDHVIENREDIDAIRVGAPDQPVDAHRRLVGRLRRLARRVCLHEQADQLAMTEGAREKLGNRVAIYIALP